MSIVRPTSIDAFGKHLTLPCYFPSVSSVKTNLSALEYIELLSYTNHPHYLISAYDYSFHSEADTSRLTKAIEHATTSGSFILLDSGNYESFWKNDSAWSTSKHNEVLRRFSPHFCFSYDNQSPPADCELASNEVIESCIGGQATASGIVIPIIHGSSESLPEIAARVADALRPPLIAVPERELGSGLQRRAQCISKIRNRLNSSGIYTPLHILGTGNPRSIALFALAGADTFDGLEWCQTSVDHSTSLLHHFQHGDVFLHQTKFVDLRLPFIHTVCLHNLAYFSALERELHQLIHRGTSGELVKTLMTNGYGEIFTNYLAGVA